MANNPPMIAMIPIHTTITLAPLEVIFKIPLIMPEMPTASRDIAIDERKDSAAVIGFKRRYMDRVMAIPPITNWMILNHVGDF